MCQGLGLHHVFLKDNIQPTTYTVAITIFAPVRKLLKHDKHSPSVLQSLMTKIYNYIPGIASITYCGIKIPDYRTVKSYLREVV